MSSNSSNARGASTPALHPAHVDASTGGFVTRNWDDLRLFLCLARESTLALAAKRLKVNKSTVYRRINALEQQMGVRLLEVRGRGYVLLPEGERLAEHALLIEEHIRSMERDLVGRDRQLAGTITLTTTDVLAREVLSPDLASFVDAYPHVCLSVLTSNRRLRLTQGEADVALRHGERPEDGDVIARRMCDVAGAFYASRRYLDEHGRPETHQDLRHHRIIGMHTDLAHLPAARLVEAIVPSEATCLRCSDVGTHVAATECGLGITPLPCFVADGRRDLVRLFPPERALHNSLWLMWHRDLRHNARVRALVDHLSEALQQHRDLFEGRRGNPSDSPP